jgi:amino-acid N-acetyltransferase
MSKRHQSTNASWTVRHARARDLPAVHVLLSSCRLSVEGVDDQFGDSYVIAEHAGEVVGVAGVERYGAYGLLRSVAVADEWRSAGIGSHVVRECVRWAEQAGMRSLYLLTTDAAPFFHRHGFHIVARASAPQEIQASREYSAMCPSTARLMCFDVDPVLRRTNQSFTPEGGVS